MVFVALAEEVNVTGSVMAPLSGRLIGDVSPLMRTPGCVLAESATGPGLAFPVEVTMRFAGTVPPGPTVSVGGSMESATVGIAGTTKFVVAVALAPLTCPVALTWNGLVNP